jgi:hypothetical protein
VSSLEGSLTKVESLTVSNFTRNLFRSIVLRSSYKAKIWLIAHIPKPAVGSPFEHGCKDGKFGLESILLEGQIFAWYEDLRTCCLNVSSLGGSLTKVESKDIVICTYPKASSWVTS